VKLLKESLNYHMLEQGHAYPTYYSNLFFDIRKAMTGAVKEARERKLGVWAKDKTMTGYKVGGSLDSVAKEAYVVPKLYRRMLDYFDSINGGTTSLEGFKEYLDERNDEVFILASGQVAGFDVAVEVDGQTVKLTEPIEELVFQEK